jgi:hypothetical protein
MLLAATAARAFDFRVQTDAGQYIYYTITSGTTVKVVNPNWNNYSSPTGFLSIPQTVAHEGTTYQVTAIDAQAFKSCSGLTGVAVPEGVVSIGRMAFAICSALDSIVLPSTLTYIGSQAFTSTAYFGDSDNLTPEGLLYIGPYLIATQTSATGHIVVPEGTRGLGNMAFFNCGQIEHITLPSTLLFVGENALQQCASLDTLFMLAAVPPAIESNAFTNTPDVVLSVPCGSAAAYGAAGVWNQHAIVEHCGGDDPDDPDDPDHPHNPDDPLHPEDPENPDDPGHHSQSIADVDCQQVEVTVVEEDIKLTAQTPATVAVYDLQGRCVAMQQVDGESRIPLPESGVYVVNISKAGSVKVLYCRR